MAEAEPAPVITDLSSICFPEIVPDSAPQLALGDVKGVADHGHVGSGPTDPTFLVDEKTIAGIQEHLLLHGISPETRSAAMAIYMGKSHEYGERSAEGRLSIRALLLVAEQGLRHRLAEQDVALEALSAVQHPRLNIVD